MNIATQKATELGVSKIIPCLTDFTNMSYVNINNLQLNAIEAAEQSERLDVPKVEKPTTLSSLLNSWSDERYLVYCDETNNSKKNIIEALLPFKNDIKKWAVLVGPEGGFSNSEKKMIVKQKKVLKVSLGKRLLRSDTAITVACFAFKN